MHLLRHTLYTFLLLLVMQSAAYSLGIGIYSSARKDLTQADVAPFSFGLILDTNLAGDSLLNFRYQIGYGTTMQHEDMFIALGFGLLRNERLRLWIGPQIGTSFQRGDTMPMPTFGPVIGFNIHLGEHFTLSIDGGCRYMVFFDNSHPIHGDDIEPFLGLQVLFRIDDTFRDERSEAADIEENNSTPSNEAIINTNNFEKETNGTSDENQ